MTLEEYARLHPCQETSEQGNDLQQSAKSYRERKQERFEIDELKTGIISQLEQGNAPQFILYTAIHAIGLLTNDPEWEEAAAGHLDHVYGDLAQESLFNDRAAIAAKRLDDLSTQYRERLAKQLKNQAYGYQRVKRALDEAIAAVEALTPKEE